MTDSNKSIVDQANEAVNAAGAPPSPPFSLVFGNSLSHAGAVERCQEAAGLGLLLARRAR